MGKSTENDNMPAELVQVGRESMIDVVTKICNKKTGKWPTPWTQSLIITLPKMQITALPELQNHKP